MTRIQGQYMEGGAIPLIGAGQSLILPALPPQGLDRGLPEGLIRAFRAIVAPLAKGISLRNALDSSQDEAERARRFEPAREELVTRASYARGARDRRTVERIEAISQRAIDSGISFTLAVRRRSPDRASTTGILRSFEARAFLETALGSGLTLADFVELMDIVSQPLRLKGVDMRLFASNKNMKVLDIRGRYADGFGRDPGIRNSVMLSIERGAISIANRDIDMSAHGKGLGFGARSLLALALFARRHGIEGWTDEINNDGILAWPSLGGEVTEDSISRARGSIIDLVDAGAVSGLDDDSIGKDVFAVSALSIGDEQVLDRRALKRWMAQMSYSSEAAMDSVGPPYPIGRFALEGSFMRVFYSTERILSKLVCEYFPRRIMARRIASLHRAQDGARQDFAESCRRAKRELAIIADMERGGGREPLVVGALGEELDRIGHMLVPGELRRLVGEGEDAIPCGSGTMPGAMSFVSRRGRPVRNPLFPVGMIDGGMAAAGAAPGPILAANGFNAGWMRALHP